MFTVNPFDLIRDILRKEQALEGNHSEALLLTPDYRALEKLFQELPQEFVAFDRPGIRSWSKGFEFYDPKAGLGLRLFTSQELQTKQRKYKLYSYERHPEGRSELPEYFRHSLPKLERAFKELVY